jgi:chemotaxis protein MotB
MALPPDDPPPGVPEWVVTYGDMMSLLLTFFIMLVSMAEMKQEGKMKTMLNSMKEQFGPLDGKFGTPGDGLPTTGAMEFGGSKSDSSEGGVKKGGQISKGLAGPSRSVKRLANGTVITLGGPTMFPVNSAAVTEAAQTDIKQLAEVLNGRVNQIVISGHASREPLPPDSPFADPFALSFARARNCADLLIARGISPARLQLVAIGDSEPKIVSRDPEAQQQNDRVDVFVVDTYTSADSTRSSPDKSPAGPAGTAASPAERP